MNSIYSICDGNLLYAGDFSKEYISSLPEGLKCTCLELFDNNSVNNIIDANIIEPQKVEFVLIQNSKMDTSRLYAPFNFSLTEVLNISGDYWPISDEILKNVPHLIEELERTILIGQNVSKFCAIIIFGTVVLEKGEETFACGEEIGKIETGSLVMILIETSICQHLEIIKNGRVLIGSEIVRILNAHD